MEGKSTLERWRDLMNVHPKLLNSIKFVKKVGTDVSHPTVTDDGHIHVLIGVESELLVHVDEIRAAYTYILQHSKGI